MYTAKEAKETADRFYSPVSQIAEHIKVKAAEGLYALRVTGIELSQKQLELLSSWGYSVESTVDESDKVVYLIGWNI